MVWRRWINKRDYLVQEWRPRTHQESRLVVENGQTGRKDSILCIPVSNSGSVNLTVRIISFLYFIQCQNGDHKILNQRKLHNLCQYFFYWKTQYSVLKAPQTSNYWQTNQNYIIQNVVQITRHVQWLYGWTGRTEYLQGVSKEPKIKKEVRGLFV